MSRYVCLALPLPLRLYTQALPMHLTPAPYSHTPPHTHTPPPAHPRQVRLATLLGTFQSTLTDFPYLRDVSACAQCLKLLGEGQGELANQRLACPSPTQAHPPSRPSLVPTHTPLCKSRRLSTPSSPSPPPYPPLQIWRTNTEAERLLGVSLTGIMDNTLTAGRRGPPQQLAELLEGLRGAAVAANQDMAAQLGIPASAAVTCVKPSGTVSQLVDAASGIHPRHAEVRGGEGAV